MGRISSVKHLTHPSWILRTVSIDSKAYVSAIDVGKCIQISKVTKYVREIEPEHKIQVSSNTDEYFGHGMWMVDQEGFPQILRGSRLSFKETSKFREWVLRQVFPNIEIDRHEQMAIQFNEKQSEAEETIQNLQESVQEMEKRLSKIDYQHKSDKKVEGQEIASLQSRIELLEEQMLEILATRQSQTRIFEQLSNVFSQFKGK